MCILANHLAFLLNGTLLSFVGGSGALGCTNEKTCTIDVSSGSVSGQFFYTEPAAARDARIADLKAAAGAPATLNAERARGTARVAHEARTFDRDSVTTSSSAVSLVSTLSFSVPVDGTTVLVPLSVVTFHFDMPSRSGRQSLTDLHGQLCETVTVHASAGSVDDTYRDVCADAPGTLDFQPSGASAFDADLVFTSSAAPSDGPSADGSAQVHHQVDTETTTCGDLGGPGIFSP